jgi:hypothetical protein
VSTLESALVEQSFRRIRQRLLSLAGYTDEGPYDSSQKNVLVHAEFGQIIDALEEIAARKVDGYGPFRYDEIEPNWRWEVQSLYQDIERKFGRLKTMVRPNPVGQSHADDLLEILSDLAVYSARAIQIIVRLEAKMKEMKS